MELARNTASVITAIGLLLLSGPVLSADAVVGSIKVVKGDAYVVNNGQDTKAVAGAPVEAGATLRTAAGASLGVIFKDNTVMSFGPETAVTVNEYAYAPNQGNLKLKAMISKGTVAYLSGAIGKMKPEAVTLQTPKGTVAVRGTHFVIKVDAE